MRGKKFRVCIAAAIMLVAVCLQGCTLKDPETSYKVTIDDSGTKIDMELKADTSQGYEWLFYTETGVMIQASTPTYRNDILSDTYITKCTYTAHEQESDTLYMVLMQNGDVDSAKAYAYPVSFDEDGNVSLGDIKEYSVGLDSALKSKVESLKE